MKQNINTNHRRRHQFYVANRIVNQKEKALGLSQSQRESAIQLQTQRYAILQTSPESTRPKGEFYSAQDLTKDMSTGIDENKVSNSAIDNKPLILDSNSSTKTP